MAGLLDFFQSASNTAASNVSAPVDGIAWLLRKAGLPVDTPIGGSDWMAQKGLTRPVQQSGASLAGETLGLLAPMVAAAKAPQIAGGLLQIGDNAMAPRTLSKQAGVFKFPQDEALAIAQRNAAKPVSEGGLGLPTNNTPEMRAKAMGFDTEAFHGTNRTFPAFDDGMLGVNTGAKSAQKAHFVAGPQTANSYIKTGGIFKEDAPALEDLFKTKGAFDEFNAAPDNATKWALLEKLGLNRGSGQMLPLNVNLGKNTAIDYSGSSYRETTFNDAIKAAKRRNNNSVTFKNAIDGGGEARASSDDIHAIFNPANIRSRFAAFDPARIKENDLLAGALPLGFLDEETRKKLGL